MKLALAALACSAALAACTDTGGVRLNYREPKPNEPSRLVYGNYCGFGTRYGNLSALPIDELDAVCRLHDACYIKGIEHCTCDGELSVAALAIAETPQTLHRTRTMARVIHAMFKTPFCKAFPQGVFRPRDKAILRTMNPPLTGERQ